MTAAVMASARVQPVVLAVEDLHWIDPTTLDLLRGIAERGALPPLLLLITARPEFRAPWAIRSHHTTISLASLDPSQVQEMVAELSARHALSKQIVDGVTERTGGVPLFVEEVTRLLLERNERGAIYFNEHGIMFQGCLFAATNKALDAVRVMTHTITSLQSIGSTLWVPLYLSSLASAYGQIGQLANAARCIDEARTTVETTGESWCEAEINRVAGEIALLTPDPDAANAEANFQQALAVARQQQAKSWELRAAMSLARLWRDQGKLKEARELLAPVYGWFREGFDTRDLKEAKALLEELA